MLVQHPHPTLPRLLLPLLLLLPVVAVLLLFLLIFHDHAPQPTI